MFKYDLIVLINSANELFSLVLMAKWCIFCWTVPLMITNATMKTSGWSAHRLHHGFPQISLTWLIWQITISFPSSFLGSVSLKNFWTSCIEEYRTAQCLAQRHSWTREWSHKLALPSVHVQTRKSRSEWGKPFITMYGWTHINGHRDPWLVSTVNSCDNTVVSACLWFSTSS